jgi:DNA repair exonuclease SbcCD ATPase subunit
VLQEDLKVLQEIRIKNFQSLHNVDLEFGKFTVIIGASSSGKSAITRAIKAVASNALDSDYITQGTKRSAVTLRTDAGTVTIERTNNGSSTYKVAKPGSQESAYTKLNRGVPTEVTEVLGLAPSSKEVGSINFASQFDAPYLLKESAGNVARILGELTNVSTIFEAVREANKKVKNTSGVLNIRKKDLDKVVSQIADYASVGEQAKIISAAEAKLAICAKLDLQQSQLDRLIRNVVTASDALSRVKVIPEVPSMDRVLNAQRNLDNFTALLRKTITAGKNIQAAKAGALEAESAILGAEEDLHQALVSMGQCPLCNQEIN